MFKQLRKQIERTKEYHSRKKSHNCMQFGVDCFYFSLKVKREGGVEVFLFEGSNPDTVVMVMTPEMFELMSVTMPDSVTFIVNDY